MTAPVNDRTDRACLVAFACLDGIGPATLAALVEHGAVSDAWERLESGRASSVPALAAVGRRVDGTETLEGLTAHARQLDPLTVLERHDDHGIDVLIDGDPAFPSRLAGDPSPIPLLFASGRLAAAEQVLVAIVGTRNATRLGCDTAGELALALARRGIGVVSGLALGIDGAAHRAMIEVQGGVADVGPPVGVVAAGLDLTYPRRHQGLQRQVGEQGLLLSEVPLGVAPSRWRFPARNRVIAALARAVIVVESPSSGGSMLTAGEALARDVPVLAVPGHPATPNAAGPLDLIADGAVALRDVEDVLVAIGRGGQALAVPDLAGPGPLDATPGPLGRAVLEALGVRPRTLGQLVTGLDRTLEEVASELVALESAGLVARSGGWFEATAHGARPLP
jgi:DNA processing protein